MAVVPFSKRNYAVPLAPAAPGGQPVTRDDPSALFILATMDEMPEINTIGAESGNGCRMRARRRKG